MTHIVWDMTVWDAGAAPTTIPGHSFSQEYICQKRRKNGDPF